MVRFCLSVVGLTFFFCLGCNLSGTIEFENTDGGNDDDGLGQEIDSTQDQASNEISLERPEVTIVPLSAEEVLDWTRRLVPLPHELNLTGQVILSPSWVAVVPPAESSPVATHTIEELQQSLGQTAPVAPQNSAFVVTLQIGGAESSELTTLPNSSQAYRIFLEADNRGLRLVALQPTGLYYAAKTLQQLIRSRSTPSEAHLPILSVRDWPEMEDRGLWGGDTYIRLEWMAERKMNLDEQIAFINVNSSGVTEGGVKTGYEPLLDVGPINAVQHVPVVLHLDQISQKGVFAAHPELQPVGGAEGAICYSQPAIVDVLADWISILGNLPYVDEVDVWLAENLKSGGCKCSACSQVNRSVLETRVVLQALEKAKSKIGEVGLRILLTEETYPDNAQVLAELSVNEKPYFYHSLTTYSAAEKAIIEGLIQDRAANGLWMGVVPTLGAHVKYTQPFTGPQFIHYRMSEFVNKKISGLLGYAKPMVPYFRFNVEAAAEWGWNSQGRSIDEFILSWAVRQGISDTEKFRQWVQLLGPVAWDVYGSEWPGGDGRNHPGPVADRLVKMTLQELGESSGNFRAPWADINSESQLQEDMANADAALVIAQELGLAEFIQESQVIQGYINSLNALWVLRKLVDASGIKEADKPKAKNNFNRYISGLNQAKDALAPWESSVAWETEYLGYVQVTLDLLTQMVNQMEDTAQSLGVSL